MIHLDYIDAGRTAAAMPTVCMHCEDPVAPCAEVCPADAILVTADGVVQEAAKERCIGCGNCVDACPFGVPKLDVAEMLQYKCNLCYDRTSVGLAPMCATVCPTSAIFYGSVEELEADRPGAQAIDVFGGPASCNVAIEFGLYGPNSTNAMSCASGTIAIGDGFREIRDGYADVMGTVAGTPLYLALLPGWLYAARHARRQGPVRSPVRREGSR